jgi:hypothetical protein
MIRSSISLPYVLILFTVLTSIYLIGILIWSDQQFDKGYTYGVGNGRRDVVDAIFMNVAQEGSVVITQGDKSITLTVVQAE